MYEEKNEQLKAAEKKEYQNLVNRVKPKPSFLENCLWAFGVGGLICMLAQFILNYLLGLGMNKIDAGSAPQ